MGIRDFLRKHMHSKQKAEPGSERKEKLQEPTVPPRPSPPVRQAPEPILPVKQSELGPLRCENAHSHLREHPKRYTPNIDSSTNSESTSMASSTGASSLEPPRILAPPVVENTRYENLLGTATRVIREKEQRPVPKPRTLISRPPTTRLAEIASDDRPSTSRQPNINLESEGFDRPSTSRVSPPRIPQETVRTPRVENSEQVRRDREFALMLAKIEALHAPNWEPKFNMAAEAARNETPVSSPGPSHSEVERQTENDAALARALQDIEDELYENEFGSQARTSSPPADEHINRIIRELAELLRNDVDRPAPNNPPRAIVPKNRDDILVLTEITRCTICFEDEPTDPVGCKYCKQLVGCRDCVTCWYRGGSNNDVLRYVLGSANYEQCPLCRHRWLVQPEIINIKKG
ncbi:unnamed protein product, partial [Mesorhabditis spiculigera]